MTPYRFRNQTHIVLACVVIHKFLRLITIGDELFVGFDDEEVEFCQVWCCDDNPFFECVAVRVLYSFIVERRAEIFLLFYFFDLGRCKDARRLNPRWFTINWCSSKPFPHSKHTQFKGRGKNNNFSTTSQDGVSQGFSYHSHSSFRFTSLPHSANPTAGIDPSCFIW